MSTLAVRQHQGAAATSRATLATIAMVFLFVSPDGIPLGTFLRTQISLRWLFLALLGLVAALSALAGGSRPIWKPVWPWVIYGAAVLGGSVVDHRLQAIPQFLFFGLLPFFVGLSWGGDDPRLFGAVRGIVYSTLALSVWAIFEFAVGKSLIQPAGQSGRSGGYLRANAGFSYPLSLSMVLAIGFFLVLAWGRGRGILFRLGAPAVVIGGIFTTQERSPLIGVLTGIIGLLLLERTTRARSRVIGITAIAVLVILLFPGNGGSSFRQFLFSSTTVGSTSGSTISYRQTLLSVGLHVVRTHPIFGIGYGAISSIKDNPVYASQFYYGGHVYSDIANYPLSVAIEAGLIGFVAFIWIFIRSIIDVARSQLLGSKSMAKHAAVALVAGLVTSVGVAQGSSSVLLFVCLGLFSSASHRSRSYNLAASDRRKLPFGRELQASMLEVGRWSAKKQD